VGLGMLSSSYRPLSRLSLDPDQTTAIRARASSAGIDRDAALFAGT
jgi:hypothetical protein